MKIELDEAAAILDELVTSALEGEEIVFTENGKTVAKLEPIKSPQEDDDASRL